MARYTFRVRALVWIVLIGIVAALAWAIARWRRQWAERQQAAEARLASFIAQASPPAATAHAAPSAPAAPQERLLFDAAAKAGEAGEPVLSIQLYARLLSRFPQTQLAAQARAAVEVQKKKLAPS
jgi:hypothetical protein